MIPQELLQPIPKFKAGDTVWIMENNKPTSINILQARVTFAAGLSDPDKWVRREGYLSLRPNYDRTQQIETWFGQDQIHRTKEELLASL